jgi:amino acid permease
MMQALAELTVMYPINGAFTMYIVRFIDPSWGFACGWQYGISWLTVLPFEISAACNVIPIAWLKDLALIPSRSSTTGPVLRISMTALGSSPYSLP